MQLEATGKSVEIAVQNGLLECGMKREDVDIKVIEEGGLFKKAKVLLTWGETVSEPEIEQPIQEVNEIIEESTSEVEAECVEEEPVEKKKRIVNTERLQAKAVEFLTGLAKFVDDNAQVGVEAKENELYFVVTGEKLGKLIGFKGENLHAIQLLLSGLKLRSESIVRMYLDINGYKANKNQTIVDLANKVAEQAIKIERNIHLDPMSAYDRRIVHTTLQDRDDVTTESTGEGEKRHVVIKPIFKK